MADENKEVEEIQPTESSTEKETQDKGQVPFHEHPRFKELIEEKNKLKEDIEALKGQKAPEEEEPSTWKEAQERATQKALEALEKKQATEAEAQRKEEEQIEASFSSLEALGEEITKEVKTAVLEKVAKTGEDVLTAYSKYKKETANAQEVEQRKEAGDIQTSKGGTPSKPSMSYEDLKKTSLDNLITRYKPEK